MSTTYERLAFINEYKTWREGRELEGEKSTIDAYEKHLTDEDVRDRLRGIYNVTTSLLDDFDSREPSQVVALIAQIQIMANLNPKEIVTA